MNTSNSQKLNGEGPQPNQFATFLFELIDKLRMKFSRSSAICFPASVFIKFSLNSFHGMSDARFLRLLRIGHIKRLIESSTVLNR